ncbi:MAG TPA: DUF4124 domain-containing protein [Usitatibacter sp.]|nr:DUF4124 domain-containing protein [Usitatibacter sp.]
MPNFASRRAVILRALSHLALGVLALGAQATVYKWVDEKGVTQYSESPPPDGKGKKIELDTSTPSGVLRPALTPEDWKQRDLEFKKRKLEREREEESMRQNTEQNATARRDRCIYAQQELNVVQSGRPVYGMNERGEKVYMEDDARAHAIEVWRKRVEIYCDK